MLASICVSDCGIREMWDGVRWFFRQRVELRLTPWEIVLVIGLTVVPVAYFAGRMDGQASMACYKHAAEYEAFWPVEKRPLDYSFHRWLRKCGATKMRR
jgi:hypothetical protein